MDQPRGDFEKEMQIGRAYRSHQYDDNGNEPVERQAGAQVARELIGIMQCAEFGRVFDDCGANTKIEQPKITSQSEHQDPHTESIISESVEDEGRQEKTHKRVNRK